MLQQMGQDIRRVVDTVAGNVVGVGRRGPVGSGLLVASGRVLTNAHNLRGERATVTFNDGQRVVGEVRGVDLDGDLAVLDAEGADVAALEMADAATVAVGDPVVAMANPGGRGLRATPGFVSGTGRTFRGPQGRRILGALEHTAPLLPGSSGGPLVDLEGRLLGLNTHRLGEGFYLALPAGGDLRQRIDALAAGEEPKRMRLGIAVAPGFVARRMRRAVGLPDVDGVLVRGVEPDGPAAAAGVEQGDLITQIDAAPVAEFDDLYGILDSVDPGTQLELRVLRGTTEIGLTVVLGAP